jgi:hypothetical protein
MPCKHLARKLDNSDEIAAVFPTIRKENAASEPEAPAASVHLAFKVAFHCGSKEAYCPEFCGL